MPATYDEIAMFLNSPEWGASEKWVIQWQFGILGGFQKALADAIKRADEKNLRRLEKAFPVEVRGFRMWAYGDLAQRLREAGLGI